MESAHAPFQKGYQTNLLSIDFEEVNCRIESEAITSKKVKKYGLNILKEIKEISQEINQEIVFYNSGNPEKRETLVEKVKAILERMAKKNYPLTSRRQATLSLENAFSPVRKECKRLILDLEKEDRMVEEKKQALERKKNLMLSELLKEEQSSVSKHSDILQNLFNGLKSKFADKNLPTPSVYIAYAWPTEGRESDETWVQNFLKHFQLHVKDAGIKHVKLDFISNRYGANINHYMKELKNDDFVLLFGTESLFDKYDKGTSAVCAELIHILHKREEDVKKGEARVFPILLSGSVRASFPPEFERFSTVRDWRKGGYLKNFQDLFLELFKFRPEDWETKLKERWAGIPNWKVLERIAERSKIQGENIRQATTIEELVSITISLEDRESAQKPLIVPRPQKGFIGRVKELAELHEDLKNNNSVVISGINGVGKTSFCRKYVDEFGFEYAHTFEILGNSIETDLLKLAKYFQIPEGRGLEVARALEEKLASEEKPTLFIIKGADYERHIKKFPELMCCDKIKVLFTSLPIPHDKLLDDISVKHMESLNKEIAIDYVKSQIEEKDRDLKNIEKLVTQLCAFPAALQIATNTIRNNTLLSLKEYLKNIEKFEDTKECQWLNNCDKAVLSTLRRTVKLIKENHGDLPIELFTFLSFFANAPIPVKVLKKKWKEKPRSCSILDALGILNNYSLITSKDPFEMQAVVKNVWRASLNAERRLDCNRDVFLLLFTFFEGLDMHKLEDREKVSILAPHVEYTLACNATLITNSEYHKSIMTLSNLLFEYYYFGRNYRSALRVVKKFIKVCDEEKFKDLLAMGLNSKGIVLGKLGRYGEAIEEFEKSLIIREELEAEDGIAEVLNNMGHILVKQKQFENARGKFQKAEEINRKKKNLLYLAMNMHGLGLAFEAEGEHQKALENFSFASQFVSQIESSKQTHSVKAKSKHSIATSLRFCGKHNQSLVYLNKGLEILMKIYHNKTLVKEKNILDQVCFCHAKVADILLDIGCTKGFLAEEKKAQKIKELLEKVKGAQKNKEFLVKVKEAQINKEFLEDTKKALKYKEKALEIRRNLFTKELATELEMAEALSSLGYTYGKLNIPKDALEKYEEALEIRKKYLPEDDELIADSLNNVGCARGELSNPDEESIELLHKALEIRRKKTGDSSELVADSLYNIGRALEKINKLNKALDHYQGALKIYESDLKEPHVRTIDVLVCIALTYRKLGKFDKEAEYEIRVLDLDADKIEDEKLRAKFKKTSRRNSIRFQLTKQPKSFIDEEIFGRKTFSSPDSPDSLNRSESKKITRRRRLKEGLPTMQATTEAAKEMHAEIIRSSRKKM